MLGSLTHGDWLRFAADLKWPLEKLEFFPPPVDFCLFLTSVSALSSDLIKLSSFKILFPFQHFSDNKNSFHFCFSTCEAQKPIFYANAKKNEDFCILSWMKTEVQIQLVHMRETAHKTYILFMASRGQHNDCQSFRGQPSAPSLCDLSQHLYIKSND